MNHGRKKRDQVPLTEEEKQKIDEKAKKVLEITEEFLEIRKQKKYDD